MKALDLFKGRKVNVITDMKVPVTLEIESVTQEIHSKDVGPANASNDWWPAQEQWVTFEVTFTNGTKKSYTHLNNIDFVE